MSKLTKGSPETPHSIQQPSKRRLPSLLTIAASLTVCLVAYLATKMSSPFIKEEKAPTKDTLGVEWVGNFELLGQTSLNDTDATITRWRSKETGLKVVHVDYEGPIVKGYFAVATEIFDDSGCPHTLEHLVFHGSEQHPYSDALQRMASRSFASTPNAYTAQDSTVYTISTAGGASFLRLLPVYVDHILYPRLTDSTFVTEVFHINGEGQDAGVVYSEMQARENTVGDLVDLAYRRKLFPPGSGYRSETGGLMESLRKLDLDKIKKYHSSYYAPHNLCLVVTGRISTVALLHELQKTVESRARIHGQNLGVKPGGWKRPFVETESAVTPKIDSDSSLVVDFPAKEERFGQVTVITIGPSPEDMLTLTAIGLLSDYLTGNIVAPLNKELVDIPAPYCTSIGIGHGWRATFTELHIAMTDVPVKYLDRLETKLRRTLRSIIRKGIDMKRLHSIIDKYQRNWKRGLEEYGGDAFSSSVLDDFLYGDETGKRLEKQLQLPKLFSELQTWKHADWVNVVERWLIQPNMLAVRSRPSSTMSDRLESEEKKRIQEQVTRLGSDGLEKQAKIVAEAKAKNEEPMPDHEVESIPIPDVKTISWIGVQSASTIADSDALERYEPSSEPLANHLKADAVKLPLALHFDHVSSQFVTLTAYISLDMVPEDLKTLVPIFQANFFASEVTLEDGVTLREEELIHRLEDDLVSHAFGYWGDRSEYLYLTLVAEVSKYDVAIQWMHRLLWSSRSTTEKLQNRIAIIKQSIPEYLRDAQMTLSEIRTQELYTDAYIGGTFYARRVIEWIPEFERRLKRDPNRVVSSLEDLRALLLRPSGLMFSVIGDVMKLEKPRSAWTEFFKGQKPATPIPVRLISETLSTLGKQPENKAFVISLANVESSFASHIALGIEGYVNPETPAVLVALEVLSGAELYFWKRIRGAGLAYGAGTGLNVATGHIAFSAWRSPNMAKAYQEAKEVVQGLVNGTIPLDKLKIEAAKISCVYSLAESYSTRGSMAEFIFINRIIRHRPSSWIQDRLAAIQAVSAEEILDAMKRHILPLFQAETSVAFVVCGPSQADDVVNGYKAQGFDVELRQLDDRVPWATDESKISAKALKALSKALLAGEVLLQRTYELLRLN